MENKCYVLAYNNFGFAKGSLYFLEEGYLVHRDPITTEILHKLPLPENHSQYFNDIEMIGESKVHKLLLETLLSSKSSIFLKHSHIQSGSWWWENPYLPFKFIEVSKNIYSFIPQFTDIGYYPPNKGHKLLEDLKLKFDKDKVENIFDNFKTLEADFRVWINKFLEETYIGAISFSIKDVKSIEHTENVVTSITLINGSKIFIK